MRAAVLREAGRLAVEEVPRPEPEPGELLLRVRDCGICGSDLHAAHTLAPGTVMGHEFAGEVAALGSGVSGWDVGEPVVALPYMACGSCAACVAGEWADRGDVESCRLVAVDWPEELPGPAFPAAPGVSVGAIVKPALGLTPEEAAAVAAELAAGGAVLVKDDELQRSSPERVRAIDAAIPEHVLYAANVTGADADAIVEAGARALMVNAFLAGLGKDDEYISQLQRLLQLRPDYPYGELRLADALFAKGEFDKAIRDFDEAPIAAPPPVFADRFGGDNR